MLRSSKGDRIFDLGAGTGDFPLLLAARDDCPEELRVTEVDYVRDALVRGAERFAAAGHDRSIGLEHVAADLDLGFGHTLPLRPQSADAVLASLLISYVRDPRRLLESMHLVLRPNGRLVLSTLRRDADISKMYVRGISELPPDRVRDLFGDEAARDFDALQRRFLNDAARLLDLEEAGQFRFWDEQELTDLVLSAGFEEPSTELSFGQPPQAVVLSARRA